jgi:hypothetical protein
MYKKWLHIILSVWLINSVTYFHGSTSADLFYNTPDTSANDECLKINSWTDCLGHLLADDDATPEKAHKIKSQRRYVRSRNASVKVFLPAPDLHAIYKNFRSAVTDTIGNYSIGVAMLPAYYAFLFRLSPF